MKSLKDRFWEKVEKGEDNECWVWTAHTVGIGYGRIKHGKKDVLAHRISWMLHVGDIPDGMCVLHQCDNPPCVNPSHLFVGTYVDNHKDMQRKGRRAKFDGERNGRSKLTPKDVLYARSSSKTQKVVAQELGVSQQMISHIRRCENWEKVH